MDSPSFRIGGKLLKNGVKSNHATSSPKTSQENVDLSKMTSLELLKYWEKNLDENDDLKITYKSGDKIETYGGDVAPTWSTSDEESTEDESNDVVAQKEFYPVKKLRSRTIMSPKYNPEPRNEIQNYLDNFNPETEDATSNGATEYFNKFMENKIVSPPSLSQVPTSGKNDVDFKRSNNFSGFHNDLKTGFTPDSNKSFPSKDTSDIRDTSSIFTLNSIGKDDYSDCQIANGTSEVDESSINLTPKSLKSTNLTPNYQHSMNLTPLSHKSTSFTPNSVNSSRLTPCSSKSLRRSPRKSLHRNSEANKKLKSEIMESPVSSVKSHQNKSSWTPAKIKLGKQHDLLNSPAYSISSNNSPFVNRNSSPFVKSKKPIIIKVESSEKLPDPRLSQDSGCYMDVSKFLSREATPKIHKGSSLMNTPKVNKNSLKTDLKTPQTPDWMKKEGFPSSKNSSRRNLFDNSSFDNSRSRQPSRDSTASQQALNSSDECFTMLDSQDGSLMLKNSNKLLMMRTCNKIIQVY